MEETSSVLFGRYGKQERMREWGGEDEKKREEEMRRGDVVKRGEVGRWKGGVEEQRSGGGRERSGVERR